MGIIVLLFALAMWYTGRIDVVAGLPLIVLAWVLISAKDSLLEGITAGLFKVTNNSGKNGTV